MKVFYGAAHPFTALLHGIVRQTDHDKLGQAARQMGFHCHGIPFQSQYPQAYDMCIHGMNPSLTTDLTFSIAFSAWHGKTIFVEL